MATNIIQHHEVDFTKGIMAKLASQYTGLTTADGLWGGNALQTVTIARHFPRNPQQAIGHRGVVDFTSGARTTDLTLATIMTEDGVEAVDGMEGTSIYRHAENQMSVGAESYVLTSCNVGFTAGAAATVSYGYITSGTGSALVALAAEDRPDVLKDGEEAYFAVVLGDDGSGIRLVSKSGGVWTSNTEIVLPSGVQSATFNSTINKNNVLDIRSAQPVYFVTTYPIDVSVNLECYDKSSTSGGFNAAALKNLGICLAAGTAHADRTGYTAPSRSPFSNYAAETKNIVLASGLTKTEDSESMNVGGYLTYTYTYTGTDLAIPLAFYEMK